MKVNKMKKKELEQEKTIAFTKLMYHETQVELQKAKLRLINDELVDRFLSRLKPRKKTESSKE